MQSTPASPGLSVSPQSLAAAFAEVPDPRRVGREARVEAARVRGGFLKRMAGLKVPLVIVPDRDPKAANGLGRGRLIDPEAPDRRGITALFSGTAGPPVLVVHDPAFARAMADRLHEHYGAWSREGTNAGVTR